MSFRRCDFGLKWTLCVALGLAACRGGKNGEGDTATSDGSGGNTSSGQSTTTGQGGTTAGGQPEQPGQAGPGYAGIIGGPGNNYRLIGRFDRTNADKPATSILGAKIGATFTGTSLSVILSDTGTDMFNVSIDGVPQSILVSSPTTTPQTYLIANGLATGKSHTVWMTKRTEPYQADKVSPSLKTGATTFYGFVLSNDGVFGPPPAGQSHVIEFLGDSGCTGYGVDQFVPKGGTTCQYTIKTQDADASVPAFAAAAAGAEIVNVSASGRGIYTSEYDQDDLTNQLPYLYKECLPPSAASLYDFNDYVPDVVVINGGGDDIFGTPGSGAFPAPDMFLSSYANLLTFMRSKYPHAQIICAIGSGTFGQDKVVISAAINQAIAQRTAAGDTNVTFFDYFTGNPNGWTTYGDVGLVLGYGCEGHSSAAGSKFLGNQLGTFIKTKMGW